MYRRAEAWITAPVGDEVLLMNKKNGAFISLNETGGQLWDLLETPRTVEELRDKIVSRFVVEEAQARDDLDQFLTDLMKHGAIESHSG